MKFFACFAVLLASQTALAATYRYEIEPSQDQTVTYDRGEPSVTSLGPTSYVSLQPIQDGKRIKLMVFIGNRGESPFEFSETNLTARVGEQPIEIITAAQLRKEANRSAAWQSAATGLAAGLNTRKANRSTFSGTVTTKTPYGQTSGTATYSGTIESGSANQQAIEQASEQSRQINQNRSSTLDHIDSTSLERTTIEPGELIGGFIAIKAPKPRGKQAIQVQIVVGGDIHFITLRELKE